MPEAFVPSRAGRVRASLRRAFLVLALSSLALPAGLQARADTAPPSFADLVTRVAPAVVNVATRKDVGPRAGGDEEEQQQQPDIPQFPPGSPFEEFFKDFFNRDKNKGQEQQQRRAFSLGSGFVIDPRGFVVTNNHVIADSDEISVSFSNERDYPAKLIGRDTKTDLALLKIQGKEGETFPFVDWADSDKARVGDWMVAIGNPFGLGSTVTAGIISARGRDIHNGPYDDFLQVDAAINRGNSGGPSFSLDGRVLGVNTAIFSPTGTNVGIGFAIPANLAKPVIDSLMQTGKVARGWLGVRIQNVDQQLAETFGLKDARGALVASTTPGGAGAAGRRPPRGGGPRGRASSRATSSSSSTARRSTKCVPCRGSWPRRRSARRSTSRSGARARRRTSTSRSASCPRRSRPPRPPSRPSPPRARPGR